MEARELSKTFLPALQVEGHRCSFPIKSALLWDETRVYPMDAEANKLAVMTICMTSLTQGVWVGEAAGVVLGGHLGPSSKSIVTRPKRAAASAT
jgi:hypothetical protein